MTAPLIPPDTAEFVDKFHQFRYSAFRLETLQSYGNSGEDADFEAFVAGRPKPENPGHEQWQAMVRANVHAGRIVQRVHEDIRVIPVCEGEAWPMDVPEGTEFVTDPARIVAACHWRDAALHHAMSWR